MKLRLHQFQLNAVKAMDNFFESNQTKGKMYLSTALEKTPIIVAFIEKLIQKKADISILILSAARNSCDQLKMMVILINTKRKTSLTPF